MVSLYTSQGNPDSTSYLFDKSGDEIYLVEPLFSVLDTLIFTGYMSLNVTWEFWCLRTVSIPNGSISEDETLFRVPMYNIHRVR